jgi:hypothetical protein
MPLMFGLAELDVMDRLHEAFDADGHANPGKLLPPGGSRKPGADG